MAAPFYTPEQYLEMERGAECKSEYLSGQIFAMAGGSPRHSLLSANVIRVFGNHTSRGSCQTHTSDLRVTVLATGLRTYPDAAIVCGDLEDPPDDPNSATNPTVLVEVLSPSTQNYDRGEKWAHYQQIPSLTDYLLVAQDKPFVEHFARADSVRWLYTAAQGLEASITLSSLGITLSLVELYAQVVFDDIPAPTGEVK